MWQSGATVVWVSHEMGLSGTDPCARPGLGLPEWEPGLAQFPWQLQ